MKFGPSKDMTSLVIKRLPPPDRLGKAGASAHAKGRDDGPDAGKASAASDVISAVKSGDSEALAEALADFVKLCGYDEE